MGESILQKNMPYLTTFTTLLLHDILLWCNDAVLKFII